MRFLRSTVFGRIGPVPLPFSSALPAISTLSAVVASVGSPRVAGADEAEAPVSLQWVRGPGAEACFDAARLERDVEDRLGWDAVRPSEPRRIVGRVERVGDVFAARLHMEEGDFATAARTIESAGDDCHALEASVVLAVALAIDPLFAAREAPDESSGSFPDVEPEPSEPCPAPPPVPPPEPCADCPAEARAPQPATASPTLTAFARALYVAGLLPNWAPGVALDAERTLGRQWSLSLGMRWLPSDRIGDRYEFSFTGGSIVACRSVLGPLDLCGGALAGAVTATVLEGRPGEAGQQIWLGLELGPRVRLDTGPLQWQLGTAAGVPLLAPRFLSENEIIPNTAVVVTSFIGVGPKIP